MSIRERKSKKHGTTYQVYFTYTDIFSNERRFYSKSGFLDYNDAVLFEKKKKIELNHEIDHNKQFRVTVDDVFQEWLILESSFKYQENTVIDYKRRYYLHIKDKLGDIKVQDLNYKILQTYFNDNSNIGITTNYKLKEILNLILNFSIKCNYINSNPMKLVYITGIDQRRNRNKVYDDEDFEKIVNDLLLHSSDIRQAYVVALYIGKYTGLRISETFALEIDDFNFESETIRVNKKMVYADKKRTELSISNAMKSKSSMAILPFHKDLQIIMKDWFCNHKHNNVISDSKGLYLHPKQLEYCLWKSSKALEISFNYHMLRHTLATKLIINGANIKATQELMRHANITTTMNIYTHVNETLKRDALYQAIPLKEVNK